MKKLILLTILIFISYSACQAGLSADSTLVIKKDSADSGIDLIAIGGLGVAYDNNFWGENFRTSPALALGLEIPFTSAHIFALELYSHIWIAKKYSISTFYHEYYINIAKDIYTQLGFSAVIRYYLDDADSKYRPFIHFGWLVLSPNRDYFAIDAGLGLSYKYTDRFSFSLSNRFLFGLPSVASYSIHPTPNLLMLNICYKFKAFQ